MKKARKANPVANRWNVLTNAASCALQVVGVGLSGCAPSEADPRMLSNTISDRIKNILSRIVELHTRI